MAHREVLDNIGYYTVTESDGMGWTGGLLVVNRLGRPIEFQCTLPVRPTRTHEILFGPTLTDHLVGEVIPPVLLSKLRVPVAVLCCDRPEPLRWVEDIPVAMLDTSDRDRVGPPRPEGMRELEIGSEKIWISSHAEGSPPSFVDALADLPDLREPFERIREAIREAQSQPVRVAS